MRTYHEPLTRVQTTKEAEPISFYWRGKPYTVHSILETWKWTGKWWVDGFPRQRRYFRIETGAETMVIYRTETGWILESIED